MNDDLVNDSPEGADLRGVLRSAVGPLDGPDHDRIRRRGRRLAALRAGAVGGGAALLIAGVVGVGLALGPGEGPSLLVIDDPAEEDTALVDGAPEACAPPNLRPTSLPWLADGEDVPPPALVRYGTDDEPNGALMWAADPEAFDPEGVTDADVVAVVRIDDHEPFGGDVAEVEVQGYTAQLMWIGGPGVGELHLVWSEGDGPCDTYALVAAILAPVGDGDESESESEDEDSYTYLAGLIGHHLERVAGSLVDGASAEAADPARVLRVPPRGEVAASFVGDHPVFVVHEETGAVRVLDAQLPEDHPVPRVVAYCRTSGWFEDLWVGSMFDEPGDWRTGTAPTGLAPFAIDGVEGRRLVVGERQDAPPRPSGDREHPGQRGPACLGRTALESPGARYEEGAVDDLVVHDPSEVGRGPGEGEGDLWFPTPERIRGELPRLPGD